MTMRAGSCWVLTTTEGAIISASRPMAGLLHVSPRQLRAGNMLSLLGGALGDTDSSERFTESWSPPRMVKILRCAGQSVSMQLAVVDHHENKLWLFSPATKIRTQNSCR